VANLVLIVITVQVYDTIAAVDLGSIASGLQVGEMVEDQIYPLDSLKETVRLAAGLTPDKFWMTSPNTALACLKAFWRALTCLPTCRKGSWAQITFRLAKNAPAFLEKQKMLWVFRLK